MSNVKPQRSNVKTCQCAAANAEQLTEYRQLSTFIHVNKELPLLICMVILQEQLNSR